MIYFLLYKQVTRQYSFPLQQFTSVWLLSAMIMTDYSFLKQVNIYRPIHKSKCICPAWYFFKITQGWILHSYSREWALSLAGRWWKGLEALSLVQECSKEQGGSNKHLRVHLSHSLPQLKSLSLQKEPEQSRSQEDQRDVAYKDHYILSGRGPATVALRAINANVSFCVQHTAQ